MFLIWIYIVRLSTDVRIFKLLHFSFLMARQKFSWKAKLCNFCLFYILLAMNGYCQQYYSENDSTVPGVLIYPFSQYKKMNIRHRNQFLLIISYSLLHSIIHSTFLIEHLVQCKCHSFINTFIFKEWLFWILFFPRMHGPLTYWRQD